MQERKRERESRERARERERERESEGGRGWKMEWKFKENPWRDDGFGIINNLLGILRVFRNGFQLC